MSKRAGEFITLDELLAEVGVDAARWFFASRAATTAHRLRHRAGQASSRTRTRSTTSSTPTPGSPRSCARPPRPGWRRPTSVAGSLGEGPRGGAGAGDRPLPGGRRGRGRRPRRPRASPPTRPSSRRRSTPSTATRGSSIRRSRSGRPLAWRSRGGPGHAGARSACWGSPRPSRCSRSRRGRRRPSGAGGQAGGPQRSMRATSSLPTRRTSA